MLIQFLLGRRHINNHLNECYTEADLLHAAMVSFLTSVLLIGCVLVATSLVLRINNYHQIKNEIIICSSEGSTCNEAMGCDKVAAAEGTIIEEEEVAAGNGMYEIQKCASMLDSKVPHPSLYEPLGMNHTSIEFYSKDKKYVVKIESSLEENRFLFSCNENSNGKKVVDAIPMMDVTCSLFDDANASCVEVKWNSNTASQSSQLILFDDSKAASNLVYVFNQLVENGDAILKLYNCLADCSSILQKSFLPRYGNESRILVDIQQYLGVSMDTLRRCGIREIPYVSKGLVSIENGLQATAPKSNKSLVIGPIDFLRVFVPNKTISMVIENEQPNNLIMDLKSIVSRVLIFVR